MESAMMSQDYPSACSSSLISSNGTPVFSTAAADMLSRANTSELSLEEKERPRALWRLPKEVWDLIVDKLREEIGPTEGQRYGYDFAYKEYDLNCWALATSCKQIHFFLGESTASVIKHNQEREQAFYEALVSARNTHWHCRKCARWHRFSTHEAGNSSCILAPCLPKRKRDHEQVRWHRNKPATTIRGLSISADLFLTFRNAQLSRRVGRHSLWTWLSDPLYGHSMVIERHPGKVKPSDLGITTQCLWREHSIGQMSIKVSTTANIKDVLFPAPRIENHKLVLNGHGYQVLDFLAQGTCHHMNKTITKFLHVCFHQLDRINRGRSGSKVLQTQRLYCKACESVHVLEFRYERGESYPSEIELLRWSMLGSCQDIDNPLWAHLCDRYAIDPEPAGKFNSRFRHDWFDKYVVQEPHQHFSGPFRRYQKIVTGYPIYFDGHTAVVAEAVSNLRDEIRVETMSLMPIRSGARVVHDYWQTTWKEAVILDAEKDKTGTTDGLEPDISRAERGTRREETKTYMMKQVSRKR